jgi:HK97 family phage major capsid protein
MATKEMSRAQLNALFEQSTDKKKAADAEMRKDNEKQAQTLRSMLADERQAMDKQGGVSLVGGVALAFAASQGNLGIAREYARTKWGAGNVVEKALNASTDTAGAFTIEETLSTDLIPMLNATAIMRKMGASTLPLVNGQLKIPKMTGGATAAYLSEGAVIAASQQTFGQLLLQGKKLAAKVPISRDLLKFSAQNVDQIVRADIVTRLSLREDLAFIEGTGDAGTPHGIRDLMLPANKIAQTATPTAVTATTDAGRLVTLLDNANVPATKRGWITRPEVKNWLATVREATGALAFPEVQASDRWWGYPITTSNQITVDGTTSCYLYLCEFPELIIGDAYTLEITASDTAAYTDSTSTLVSAFDRDETVIKAIEMHDFGMRHNASVAALTGCTWGH